MRRLLLLPAAAVLAMAPLLGLRLGAQLAKLYGFTWAIGAVPLAFVWVSLWLFMLSGGDE